jgi:eukaryotic-like serine/threonine-protein kinase
MEDRMPKTAFPNGSPRAARRFAERFEVLQWLGEGGMGTVYLARDERTDRRVAVKVLLGRDPDALSRFKQEFRALADISHPNLIVLHELLCDGPTWLFTMDYVEGRDFLQHVSALDGREAPTLLEVETARERAGTRPIGDVPQFACPLRDEALLRHVLGQLVDAVRSLHAASKLHLDLKPSNVLVSERDHVTVLDFGLARDLKQSASHATQRLLGTPAYMAPEHAESGRFEPASDWYAVGVMLYETLTGRLPFEGPVAHVLLSKTSRMPARPSSLCRDVPPQLEALCMDLLAREPDKRPSGAEISQRVGAVPRTVSVPSAPHVRATRELFVGRSKLLERLRRERAGRSEPRILLLHGPAGVGKTTLARRFVDELAREPRVLVLRGACYEREAMPFKAFDGIVDSLIAYLAKLAPLEIGALLPRHANTLSQLFPAFAAVPAPAPARRAGEEDEPSIGRARAFRAFAELFGRLSDHHDLVLFIDDLQFSDLDSALLLRALLEGSEPVPLLLVGTHRSDVDARGSERAHPEDAHSPLLAQLRELAGHNSAIRLDEAELGPLDQEEASTLAAQLLHESSSAAQAIAGQIALESQGVPLFIHELVRYLAQREQAPAQSVSLHDVLLARVAVLPAESATLLEVLAVAGGPLVQRVAYEAAELSTGREAALHVLRVAGLARSRKATSTDLIETAHDRISGAVLSRLTPERLIALHERLLDSFAREPVQDDERLFRHSLGAGQPARALEHGERAAAHARSVLAFHRSAELYRVAVELCTRVRPSDHTRRALLLEGLADALAASGHSLDAAQAYLEAAALLASTPAAALEQKAADQLLRGGDLQRGTELLARVLERVGVSYPRSPRAALAALTFERARLFARGLSFSERSPPTIELAELERLDALRVALGVYWLVEPVRGALFATQYLRLALDAGHARHVLRGLEIEAAYVALTGGAKSEARSGELYMTARALTQRIGSASTQAGYKIAEAGFHAMYGRKQKSSECAREALAAPKQHGVRWEQTYARFHLYQNALYIGATPGLADEILACVVEAETRRDRFSTATLLPMLAMARMMSDEPARAHEALARMRPLLSEEVFSFLDVQEMIWTALTYQYEGQPAAALAHYAARADRYAVSGMPRLSIWRVLQQWGALLAHLGAVDLGLDRERHMRAAEVRIKQMERERIEWPTPFVSMGSAALLHVRGDRSGRDRALLRATRQAEALGYRPFVALFARSAALLAGDGNAVQQHEQTLAALGVASPVCWQRTWAPCLH